MIDRGFFLITDISGYTAYLARNKLEHAQLVITALIDAQIAVIKPAFDVSNFQGDAILTCAPAKSVVQGQTLLEVVENIYFAFAERRDSLRGEYDCDCDACQNADRLDLKMFVHCGDFAIQEMGGRRELMGPEVILAHRMMKNTVVEQTGIEAYALFTRTAAELIDLETLTGALRPHAEEYDSIGRVEMLVHDLGSRWLEERQSPTVAISPEEAWLTIDTELPISAPLLWDYLTEPGLRQVWENMDSVARTDDLGGRCRTGSAFHCAHGTTSIDQHIISWKPFEYFTVDMQIELDGNSSVFNLRETFWLTPTEQGTKVASALGRPDGPDAETSRPAFEAMWQNIYQGLQAVIARDLEAGTINAGIESPPD